MSVRVISALLAVPAFFLGSPTWVKVIEGTVIVATIAALIILAGQRPPKPETT